MHFTYRILLASVASSIKISVAEQLPLVDLGYEIHQAISYNSSSQLYNFTNIRYAQPPLGEFRFSAPHRPTGRNPDVQNGSVGVICPQASGGWQAIATAFTTAYTTGQRFNLSETVAGLDATNAPAPFQDPRTTEDCLFLDVIVPKPVFDAGRRYLNQGGRRQGAAVLVWIHGGGYTSGEKGGYISGNDRGVYDPTGLIEASQVNGSEGIVFVTMNYRLGAFGWLSGPTLQSNGTANAGLYDQRLALEWIGENIHLFGGDAERITVMGESAGGGSVLHHLTAYGGTVRAPFQQAILQSAGFNPVQSNNQQEHMFQEYLTTLNVTTIGEARQLPSSTLMAGNAEVVLKSDYGTNTYGPVVDGSLVPGVPGKLLLQGAFDKTVKVMVSHNSNEGVFFTNPRATDDTTLAALTRQSLPHAEESVVDYVINTLYPAVYDGSRPYRDIVDRTMLIAAEFFYTCNTHYLATAYGNNTYTYFFSVPPGIHAQDVPYTFYTSVSAGPSFNATVAMVLQEYLTSFVQHGIPSGEGLPSFPLYGPSSVVLNLNISGITTMRDPTAYRGCRYWQKALYY